MLTATIEEQAELEANASRYGCGADGCTDCYPLIYRCADCGHDYDRPFINDGSGNLPRVECDECGFDGWLDSVGGK